MPLLIITLTLKTPLTLNTTHSYPDKKDTACVDLCKIKQLMTKEKRDKWIAYNDEKKKIEAMERKYHTRYELKKKREEVERKYPSVSNLTKLGFLQKQVRTIGLCY